MKTNRMSIDPGISGAGWAIWPEDSWTRFCRPLKVGICTHGLTAKEESRIPEEERWHRRCQRVVTFLLSVAESHRATHIYSEMPTYFAGKSVASKKDDIIKLTYQIAMLEGRTVDSNQYANTEYTLIPVNTWKGQLQKEEVERRIMSAYQGMLNAYPTFRSHEFDAVGIGLHAKGFPIFSQKERLK